MAQETTTAAELAAAQVRLDAYNAATGSNLKLEQPTPRYEDLTPPERAALDAWSRVSADTTGMLYAVRAALTAAQPIGPDARDRLARHLYLTESRDELGVEHWDGGAVIEYVRDQYLRKADELLAVITGTKEN